MLIDVTPPGSIGNSTLVILAAIFGNTLAVAVGAFLNQRGVRKAQEDASKAQLATINAQTDAAKAQASASQAARDAADAAIALVAAAKVTTQQIDTIVATSEATHKIVNNQRTVMLRVVALQARRIANDNRDDGEAQKAARDAEADLLDAERVNEAARVSTELEDRTRAETQLARLRQELADARADAKRMQEHTSQEG